MTANVIKFISVASLTIYFLAACTIQEPYDIRVLNSSGSDLKDVTVHIGESHFSVGTLSHDSYALTMNLVTDPHQINKITWVSHDGILREAEINTSEFYRVSKNTIISIRIVAENEFDVGLVFPGPK